MNGFVGGDGLGWSVAISADGERVAMGAPTDLVEEPGYVSVCTNFKCLERRTDCSINLILFRIEFKAHYFWLG